jgi:cytochrome oxidase Cu insertion factor (SCO1/SenC/PrrC family)
MTVHAVTTPDLNDPADAGRRTVAGRVRMLLVLLVCAAPVIASYFTYFVIRPEGRTNYAELILPTKTLPASLPLVTLDGVPAMPASLKGQWLLVVVIDSACDPACEQRLFMQRQLREMLGRDRDRLDKLVLVTDEGPLRPELRLALEAAVPATVLRVPEASLAAWLTPASGQPLQAHLYVVDPLGEWMMRMPPEAEPQKAMRDLVKLLRASAGWDKAGR